MDVKKKLFAKVLQFAYEPGYEKLNILSKQYFASVIFSRYQGSPSHTNTIIFADFDKLNQINQEIGFDAGTRIMYRTMQQIRTILPKNAQIARIAGDEFAFIIEKMDQEQASSYIEKINEVLEQHRLEILEGYTSNKSISSLPPIRLTCEAVDSNHSDGLYNAYKKAEAQVNHIKNKSNQSTISPTLPYPIFVEELIKKSYHSMLNFFDCLRCSGSQQLTPEQINGLFSDFVEKSLISPSSVSKEDNSVHSEDIVSDKSEIFSEKEAKIIHNLVLSPSISHSPDSISSEELKEVSSDTLLTLIDYLMRNPNTGELSKEAFEMYIKPYLLYPVNAKLLSTSFLKVSNAQVGHFETDCSISKLSKDLHDELSSFYNFDSTPYLLPVSTIASSDFLVSLDSSEFLLISSIDKIMTQDQWEELIQRVNQKSSILKLVNSPTSVIHSTDELLNYIKEAFYASSTQKNALKMSFLNSEQAVNLFQIYFKDVIHDYRSFFGQAGTDSKNIDLLKQIVITSAQRTCIKKDLLPSSNSLSVGSSLAMETSPNVDSSHAIQEPEER